jgi:Putative DNA-binding domain
MQESQNMSIISAFVQEWILCVNPKEVLHIKASTFNFFPDFHSLKIQEIDAAQNIPKNIFYDLILGDLPFGMNSVDWNDGVKIIKAQRNWLEILKSLMSLEENGTALFVLEPLGFSTSKGVVFENELNERGFFVNAFINCPEKILLPETAITPVLVVLSKKQSNRLFVAELLDDSQAREVVRAYFSNIDEGNLICGKYIKDSDYSGFHRIKIKEQIERLETQYKTYEERSLGGLALEINYVKTGEQFQERDNAIYIPKIGNSQVICKIEDAKLKHQNYFQVVLSDSVSNEYVASFFRSTLGKLVIDSLTSKTFIPHLNKKDIEQALVALPSLDEQKSIVRTHNKLHDLKTAIDGFDSELAINPTSSSSILGQLDMMLEAIGSLTDADKVRSIVREGETKYVEFKETLSLCTRTQTKNKELEHSTLKNIVAFLNTDGGKLLIGVSDDGQILGLNTEIGKFHKNLDKFLLHWKNLLKDRIGAHYYPFIEYRIIKVDDKQVLFVQCKRSRKACFLDEKDFYVRTNPATDKLEGTRMQDYIDIHFK